MNVDGNELANIDMREYRYKNVTKKFHIVGKISKLQDPECHLDARRWRAIKALKWYRPVRCMQMHRHAWMCSLQTCVYICITC